MADKAAKRDELFEKLCKEFGLGREVPDGDGWGVTWYPDPNVIAAFVELLAESQRTQAPSEQDILRQAKAFIEYARYELEDGKAEIGDQFPKKVDADQMIAKIEQALTAGTQAQAAQSSDEEPFHGSVMCDGPS